MQQRQTLNICRKRYATDNVRHLSLGNSIQQRRTSIIRKSYATTQDIKH